MCTNPENFDEMLDEHTCNNSQLLKNNAKMVSLSLVLKLERFSKFWISSGT